VKENLKHRPVLLDEAVEALNIRPDGCYLDATFGRGGHAAAILERLGPQGRLLALDRDPQAVAVGEKRFAGEGRLTLVNEDFAQMHAVAEARGLTGRIHGVLMDLGVSSPQLDDPARGFSFLRDGPLDMRMDPRRGESAAAWLARADEAEIAWVIKEYGEERYARRIARAIVAARNAGRAPATTGELAALVVEAVPRQERHKHPATRTFQAIRIHVNRELEALAAGLEQALALLAPGGRLAVISFHSLEDRIVKRFMRRHSQGPRPPRGLPVPEAQLPKGPLRLVGKPIRPGEAEVAANPRARSAILRVAEKRS